jgi:hypothetical protein
MEAATGKPFAAPGPRSAAGNGLERVEVAGEEGDDLRRWEPVQVQVEGGGDPAGVDQGGGPS